MDDDPRVIRTVQRGEDVYELRTAWPQNKNDEYPTRCSECGRTIVAGSHDGPEMAGEIDG